MRAFRLVALLLLTCAGTASMADESDVRFHLRSTTVGGRTYPYSVFIPPDWTAERAWPVVLFLHGAGERGEDGLRPTQVGLGPILRSDPRRVPAIVVFPQAPAEERWLEGPADAAMRALDEAIEEFSGDRDRVYLTGISMGGYGTWHLAMAHPDVFAAMVPVCGGIIPRGSATSVRASPFVAADALPQSRAAYRTRNIPAWLFHGADDRVILANESRSLHWWRFGQKDGAEVRHTEYEGVGHNAWDRAYAESEMWEWMFRQRRSGPKDENGERATSPAEP